MRKLEIVVLLRVDDDTDFEKAEAEIQEWALLDKDRVLELSTGGSAKVTDISVRQI